MTGRWADRQGKVQTDVIGKVKGSRQGGLCNVCNEPPRL